MAAQAYEAAGISDANGDGLVDNLDITGESVRIGDLNDDKSVDNLDITPFVDALRIGGDVSDPDRQAAFGILQPGGIFPAADVDEDGSASNLDITPFIELLSGLTARLANDTAPGGATNQDGITSDPSVRGVVRIPGVIGHELSRLRAGFDERADSSFVDVFAQVQADGRFLLDANVIEAVNGQPLTDSAHVLHLKAEYADGLVLSSDLAFTLDTTARYSPGSIWTVHSIRAPSVIRSRFLRQLA